MKKVLLLFLLLFPLFSLASEKGRYIYEGNGEFSIQKKGSTNILHVTYRNADGSYNQKGLDQINVFFGMPTAALKEGISLRLISMIDYLEDKFSPKKTLVMTSGYRSPDYNAKLRTQGKLAGETSYHINGMAADLIFPGADALVIWNYVKDLNCCGIGNYGSNILHIDAGKPRFWTAGTALPKDKSPPENKNIYLSIDKDFYNLGEKIQMFFSGISQFPIGVKPIFKLMDGEKIVQEFSPEFYEITPAKKECVTLPTRIYTRLITWNLPTNLSNKDHLGISIEFCNKTEKMPESILSRTFTIQ